MEFTSSAEQNFMKRLLEVIDANLHDENFGVAELAAELGMSRSTLHRKVKSVVNKSVNEFIRETRLKRAHKLLEKKDKTVSEIAYEVGFGSVSYFNRSFHKHFGYTPGDVQRGAVKKTEKQENKANKKGMLIGSLIAALILVVSASTIYLINKSHKTSEDQTLLILTPIVSEINAKNLLEILWQEIHSKVNKLDNLYVVSEESSRIWSERSELDLKDISKKGIEYVLKMDLHTLQDESKTWLELIETSSGEVLLSESYALNDISGLTFEFINNIVRSIVSEINIQTSGEDIQRISSYSTSIQTAHLDYNLGKEQLKKYNEMGSGSYLENAKKYFFSAINYDPEYADAYVQLANIYAKIQAQNLLINGEFSRAELQFDSALIMTEKAIEYNQQLGEAWLIAGDCYLHKGMTQEAEKYYAEARKYMDTGYGEYQFAMYERINTTDLYKAIESFYQYVDQKPMEEFTNPAALRKIIWNLYYMGFPELSKQYVAELFEILQDTLEYESYLYEIDLRVGNFERAKERYENYFQNRPNIPFVMLRDRMWLSLYLDNLEEAYKYLLRSEEQEKVEGRIPRIDPAKIYLYRVNGREKEAQELAEKLINEFEDNVRRGNANTSGIPAGMVSMAYACLGEKEKALEYLHIVAEKKYVIFIGLQIFNA